MEEILMNSLGAYFFWFFLYKKYSLKLLEIL